MQGPPANKSKKSNRYIAHCQARKLDFFPWQDPVVRDLLSDLGIELPMEDSRMPKLLSSLC